ncbi:hypothetical protein QTP88_000593 [Uroleucon formosanum]
MSYKFLRNQVIMSETFKKKNSGFQNRKNKKKIKIENEKLANTFEKWVSTSTTVSPCSSLKKSDVSVKIHNDLNNVPTINESQNNNLNNPEPLNDTTMKIDTKSDESKLSKVTAISDKDKSNITESSVMKIDTKPDELKLSKVTVISDKDKSNITEPRIIESSHSKIISVTQQHSIDYNNPPSWVHMTDDLRITLIRNKNALFCFPCCLFEYRQSQIPLIANRQEGFSDWKNINRIEDHETSPDHRKYFVQWKTLGARLKNSQSIDKSLQNAIFLEKERWRHILRAILNSILFCAKNNLALRGSTSEIGVQGSGVFLDIVELLSKYDKTLEELISNHTKRSVNYLSPTIQNEFVNLLGKKVRNEILSRIRKSKYYSLLFDCTPDVSHNEQMSEIIRYVYIANGKVKIEESFIDFIITEEKTGEGLASDIMKKLQDDQLDIQDARGQGYDNGANMAGNYRGVQARIQEKNNLALYIPCASHCLNLAGVHSASINAEMKHFFETVESIFKFFSRSTSRWTTLMQTLKVSLKGHSDTRWSSKSNAIKPLNTQIKEVYGVLQNMIANSLNADTTSSAQSLLKNINLTFLFYLNVWNQILGQVDRATKALQMKTLTLDKAASLIQALKNSLQEFRNTEFEENFTRTSTLVNTLGITNTSMRFKKKKRLELYEGQDDGIHISEIQQLRISINNAVDVFINQLNWRYEKLMEVADDFGFLSGASLYNMSTIELKKAAMDLAMKYEKDINCAEFIDEITDFQHVVKSIIPDHIKSATVIELLQLIQDYNLKESYPNIEIVFRIFLTMPVTAATCERSFSKLKLIKNYLRSTMSQERLSNLSILSIKNEVVGEINFEDVIDEFAAIKSRKVKL